MEIRNLFDKQDLETTLRRIGELKNDTQALWGKMSVAQMLAHCNVAYEMAYTDKHPQPNAFTRFFLKLFVKKTVVGPKPYAKNNPTAPAFKITEDKNFEEEKTRLIAYLNQTYELGASHFKQKESNSFGPLSTKEWNVLFSKHLDHHLRQFGV